MKFVQFLVFKNLDRIPDSVSQKALIRIMIHKNGSETMVAETDNHNMMKKSYRGIYPQQIILRYGT
jgi:hypothetical protein